MTREEFIEDVMSLDDLIDFCRDEDIDVCDDVIDADELNRTVLDDICNFRHWHDVHELLDNLPWDCSYYIYRYGNYEDADEYFDEFKEDVIAVMDAREDWDEEYNDEDGWDDEDTDDDEDLNYLLTEQITEENEEEIIEIAADAFMAMIERMVL